MRARYDYAILGGGVAGGEAAETIRRREPAATVVLFNAEPHRPYNRPPLSKGILLDLIEPERVFLRPAGYYEQRAIDLYTGAPVSRLDAREQALELEDGSRVGFGKLLYAPGSRPRRLSLPGSHLEQIYTLRTLDDSLSIRQAMRESETAIVIGGTFIAAEVASAFAQEGLTTTMVLPERHLSGGLLDDDLGRYLNRLFQEQGVRLLRGHRPVRFEGRRRVSAVVTDGGERLYCDLVVVGIGARPNVELARDAGLAESADGGLLADRYLRSSHPNIYLAGDVASYADLIFGQGHLRVEHWDAALHHGMIAGANMAGAGEPYDRLPYFFSLLFGLYPQIWGNLTGWDRVVRRGEYREGSFAQFYFRQGVLNAVLAVARPHAEVDAARRWIRQRRLHDEVAPILADERADLAAELQPA